MNKKTIMQSKVKKRIAFRVLAVVMSIVILCAGTAFAAASETLYIVDIYEGSQVTRIETAETEAEKIVAEAGIQLSDEDKLILDDFKPEEDSRITICRASNVTFIHADGRKVNIVFAGTVKELIDSQGVTLSENLFSSVDVKAVVTNDMVVEIINSFDVKINVDGEEKSVKTIAATVADLLKEQKIVLDENDEVSPSLDTALTADMVIEVLRVEYVTREAEETVEYKTETVKSSAMAKGTEKVTQNGENGLKTVTYKDKVVNGEVKSSEVVSEKITKQPVNKIVTIGTLVTSTSSSSNKLGNNKIEKNGNPISEIPLPSRFTIDGNNVPTDYKYTITGRAAAYCIPGGITSTGKPVKPGYIAVNPKQIPYGTEMWIVSNDGVVYGYAIAADTGGFANKGYYTVDLYMNSVDQCYSWGSRYVTIYVL